MMSVRCYDWRYVYDNTFAIDIAVVPVGKVFIPRRIHVMCEADVATAPPNTKRQVIDSLSVQIISNRFPPPPLANRGRIITRAFHGQAVGAYAECIQLPDKEVVLFPGNVLEVVFAFNGGTYPNYAEATAFGYGEPVDTYEDLNWVATG